MSRRINQYLHACLRWISNELSENDKLFSNLDDDLKLVLKFPWTLNPGEDGHHPLEELKRLRVQVFSKIGLLKSESDFKAWYLSINYESEYVRMEAIISMPLIVIWAGAIMRVFKKLESLSKDELKNMKSIYPYILSCLSCLYGSYGDAGSQCKLFGDIDPQSSVPVSIVESKAEILIAVDIHSPLFPCSLMLLVDQLDNASKLVQLTAANIIHRACSFHKKGGIKRILPEVGHIQSELLNHLSVKLHSKPKLITEFAEAVIGTDTKDLVRKMMPEVLPKLAVAQQELQENEIEVLHGLAKCLNMSIVQLIVTWLPQVLAYALNQKDKRNLNSILEIYHAHAGSARVPQAIEEVAKALTGNKNLLNFLKNHFVGLLECIDRKMLHSKDILMQKQALKRIKMLTKMMGCYLRTYVPKLMVILLHAIHKEALQSRGLRDLHFIIKHLSKGSPSCIKQMISQVFAALVPFLEREEDSPPLHLKKVVSILEELVFNNKSILKQHMHEFPPLPSIPELAEVDKILHETHGPITFKDQLRAMVDGLNNENLNVEYMVACELRKLLELNRDDVTGMLIGELDSEMGVLSSRIASLLGGCAEESTTGLGQRLKLVCADCLGALGAIDPAKVKRFSSQRFKIECSDDDLIFELIHKHLARAFRAAPDTIVQDSAALYKSL
ncbi:hypothetical protein QQ045_006312 [Rhodiola kirilowii]